MSIDKISSNMIGSKFTHYLTDGHGRDTYINCDNGGLLRNVQLGYNNEVFNIQKYKYHISNLKREGRSIKYRSDGTGRDSYVMDSSGGFQNDYTSTYSINFKDYLRNYPKSPVRQPKQNLNYNFITKKEWLLQRNSKKQENKLINRLYYSEKFKFTKPKIIKNDLMLKNSLDGKFSSLNSMENLIKDDNKKRFRLKPINSDSHMLNTII